MSISKPIENSARSPKRRKIQHQSDEDDDLSVSAGDATASSEDENHNGNGKAINGIIARQGNLAKSLPKRTPIIASGKSANMLQVQLNDLLSHVNMDHDAELKTLKQTTDVFTQLITTMDDVRPMNFAQAQAFAKQELQVKIPWSLRPTDEINYSFGFQKPTKTTIEGTLSQKLSIKGPHEISIMPQMPAELFQDKDYLNHRALHKRAFYLACIASTLRMYGIADAFFAFHEGNELVPVLQIPSQDEGVVFEICPSFPESLGPIEKMRPTQNCLRKDNHSQTSFPVGSPVYNGTIRHLASIPTIRRLTDNAASKADNFRQACQIGAIWLRQRGFFTSKIRGGFGLQEWAVLCALLLESGGHQGRPLFSPRYSALQLFKALLQVLSTRDMTDPFVLRGSVNIESSGIPIVFDAMTGVNIMYKMSPWSYAKLRQHATSSLAAVNSKSNAAFDATFVAKVSEPILAYDESFEFQPKDVNADLDETQSLLYDVLRRGLGDRVTSLDLHTSISRTWGINSVRSVEIPTILIGLSIQSDTAIRLVDHGPSVEDKDSSEEFRSFWGEKAELRRFKDGRINESVVWSSEVSVTQQIVQYLIAKYFRAPVSSVRTPEDLLKSQLRSRFLAEDSFTAVNSRFQSLSSTLHHLDGLPLPIRSVSAASEYARSASKDLPLESSSAKPIDVFVQFDTSGRWPDDLRAIQYTKIAFLTKIGDLLTQKDKTLQCRVGIEHSSTSTIGAHNTSFLDVIQQSTPALPPFVFRLRIYHERELHLMQEALSSKTSLAPSVRETYQDAFSLHKRAQASMSHTTTIRTLVTAFPPLSATIRLLKRFLSVHRLSKHIPSEVAEIIAAQVFLRPAPWSVPGTATTAFARCLYFLSRWDWSAEPLIVDLSLSQDMPAEQRQDLETRFIAWRKMDPNLNNVAWFVGTNLDSTGVVWTQGNIPGQDPSPPRVVAGRLTALASAAVELFQVVGNRESKIMDEKDWNDVFTSSVEHFDFVIHLKKAIAGRSKSANGGKAGKFKNLELAQVLDADTTGIDAVQCYMTDLERAFGHLAIFFCGEGTNKDDLICGLWRPHVRKGAGKKELKIRLGMSTLPLGRTEAEEDSVDCEVNTSGMLAEMSLLGTGLVDNVTHN